MKNRIILLILFINLSFATKAYCLNGKGKITKIYRDFIDRDEFLICWHRGEKPANCFRADPEILENKSYILANNSNIEEWVKHQNGN